MTAPAEYSEPSPTFSQPSTSTAHSRGLVDPVVDDGTDVADRTTGRSWDGTWVLRWREVGILIAALLTVIGVGTVIGLTLTDWAAPNAITRLDDRVAERVRRQPYRPADRHRPVGGGRGRHVRQDRHLRADLRLLPVEVAALG